MGLGGGALGPGEELVPGPEQGAFALHQQRQRLGGGDQLPQGMTGQDLVHLRRQRRRQPVGDRKGVVAECPYGCQQHRVQVGLRHPGGGARVELGALLQDEPGVDAGRDLDTGGVTPGGDRVAPGLDAVRPPADGGRGDAGTPAVGAGGQLAHGGPRGRAALRILEHHVGGDHTVSLPEERRGDLEGLADDCLRGTPAALDERADVPDGDSADGRGRDRAHGSHLRRARKSALGRTGVERFLPP
ncbi:hypothetical protein SsS58_08454 [Streptomyces scabiei]|uniref:Uncharacterized protein n=1 Tax=Streptomyces scabiei TaxID=1930 RepID=A0A100JYH5_STRSC|nr:hypothetical protein SsS58_08454 [Streptomyces scabiei]